MTPSTNGAGAIGHPMAKNTEVIFDLSLTHYIKTNLGWITDLNVKCKTETFRKKA
jgi:hypothetical protein